ncbi:Holliday junction branch migration protein RuvA [Acholeplasma vituli]|uniref:Holliday junction branch migration complex subunit RuvA n=1 Tax=Paracholeplasma vituli TaxID=69473 RepID=A0ABT2PVR5_9MOLU|nr:Holliday junction branch migration protein RuvA [Paracholeplasma vituli]MCU0105045.1 Holliday junction branch migration protein RuvA [Paracholeplasma vituli]
MYAYIVGTITEIEPTNVVVDNQGVGYLIIAPNPYIYTLGESVKMYVHHHVREDQDTLYGFDTKEARRLFQDLISVSGIGPKSALSILASGKPEQIEYAIENQDVKFLTKFPGIGPKSAQQIILDLKGKLDKKALEINVNQKDEVQEALIALGYSPSELRKVLSKLDPALSIEKRIKQALQMMIK